MTQTNLLELSKQGDSRAIAALINRALQPKGITAKVTLKNSCLQVMLEATQTPEQKTFATFVHNGVAKLEVSSIEKLKVFGRQLGEDFPEWQQEFQLQEENPFDLTIEETSESQSSTVTSVEQDKGELQPSKQTLNIEPKPQENQPVQEQSWLGSIFGAVSGVAGAATGAVVGTANTVGGVANQAGQVVVGTTFNIGGAIATTAMQAPAGVGYLFNFINDSPQLQELTKALQLDRIIQLINEVDIVKAEIHVKDLQKKYPNEKPGEISHRVMMEKALYVGGTGFASSLLPGFAAAMFAVDLAANMALQAEMIYQIACAYGLDLGEPARKGEVAAIFGLALGGNSALKAGLGFARNVPVAGSLIGASSNAAMLYALGYAACQFYATKLNLFSSSTALESSKAEADKYLQNAINQEVIMDQILVHVFLADKPNKTWEQILPELHSLNLSPASLETIKVNAQSPPSLESLLSQINSDFAIPLIAQCQKIVVSDGITTPSEAKLIAIITNRLKVNSAVVK